LRLTVFRHCHLKVEKPEYKKKDEESTLLSIDAAWEKTARESQEESRIKKTAILLLHKHNTKIIEGYQKAFKGSGRPITT
jgi:hypothetical protein